MGGGTDYVPNTNANMQPSQVSGNGLSGDVKQNGKRRDSRSRTLLTFIPFTIVALCCAALTWLLLNSLQAEHRERAQATQTLSLLWMLRDINRPLMAMESAQRGYLLTQDTVYLAPYEANRDSLEQALPAFSASLAQRGDSGHIKRGKEINTILAQKIREMDDTIRLERAGDRNAALAIVMQNSGEALTKRYRALRDRMELDARAAHLHSFAEAERLSGQLLPLLVALVVMTFGALAFGFWQVLRTARVEADAREVQVIAAAHERSDLLARELNHRVKNLFAIVQSIVRMTARRESDADILATKIGERINALALAHQVSQGALERPVADLHSLVEATLAPYTQTSARLSLEGPEVEVSGRASQPVGLILHELATNAVKYGAWSNEEGRLAVRWQVEEGPERRLLLTWEESGVPPCEAGPEGFGTQMMAASARQVGGKIEREFCGDRMTARLSFPLR